MVRKILIYCSTVLAFVALACTVAQAKPKEPEAEGIQAGGFVMHPGIDLGIAYDSRGSQGSDDGLADLGVHFRTRLADDKIYSWNNSIAFKWRQFWGLGDAKVDGGPDVSVKSDADLFKMSFFRLAPTVQYTYDTDPEDENLRKDYTNHHVRAGVTMALQPSGGAIFSERIGYNFDGIFYTDYVGGSHMTHQVTSVTRWNFLPQTSMALNIDFRALMYLEDQRTVIMNNVGADTTNYSSFPIRIVYSLQGLLLSRLSYALGFGYAYENYQNGNKEHMFIMNARLRYEFTETAGIFVEYKKDFDNVVAGDYYKYHRATLGFDALWFDHLTTSANVGFGAFDFRSIDQNARNDYLVTAGASIYYHFFPGMKLGLDYTLRFNNSNVEYGDYVKNLVSLNFAYEY